MADQRFTRKIRALLFAAGVHSSVRSILTSLVPDAGQSDLDDVLEDLESAAGTVGELVEAVDPQNARTTLYSALTEDIAGSGANVVLDLRDAAAASTYPGDAYQDPLASVIAWAVTNGNFPA